MQNVFFKNMLKELYISYKSKNVKRIKSVERKTTEELVLGFDKDMFNTALLCFMIGKLISKERLSKHSYILKIDSYFNKLSAHLRSSDYIGMRSIVEKMIKTIDTLDEKDKKYINKLAYNGRVKIGAKLYAQGLSLGTASRLAGADKFDVLSYVGHTMMSDRVKTYKPIKKRISELSKLFMG